MNNANNERNNAKYAKVLNFPQCHASGCRADTRKSWTGSSRKQERDSGMPRLELGSGLQAGWGPHQKPAMDEESETLMAPPVL